MSYKEEVRQAAKVTAAQTHLVLRYNPVACACPPFELQVGSRWVRVALEGVKEVESAAGKLAAKAAADNKRGSISHYKIKGELDDKLRRCAGRAIYMLLAVDSGD
jgi:hypothetical protein